ncbi:MAG: DUF2723 domain-containing protein, partial [bacterium]|nr:DUF2723 domain-containing protein [bacterium]
LHLFFMVLLLAALFLENKDKSGYTGVPFGRRLCLIALLLGFGFANHMMTVLIVPAVAVWFGSRFLESGNGKSERMEALQTRLLVRTLLMAVFFFSLGIMLYLYLPLRSSIRPAVELGPVRTLANLWGHVTGKQFQGWMFSRSTPEVTYYLREYRVIDQFSLLGGLLGTIGAWEMAKCSPFYFFPLLCFFLADLVYAVNYNIPDIAPYFIPSYLVFAIWMAWGLRLLLTYRWPDWESSRWRKTGSALSAVVAVLFSVWLPYYSYCRFVTLVREARQPAARMYARKVFDRVPERSVVLSIGTGETFSLWHRQACVPWAAEKEIKVVLRTYLAFPWYIDKLSEENPDLDFSPVHTLAHSYLGHWNDIDFLEYRRRLNDLTLALIRTNFSRCTLYLTNKKLFDSEEYFLAQAGPVFRVLKK